jgi:hypothetical protein
MLSLFELFHHIHFLDVDTVMTNKLHGHSWGVDGRAKATPEYHSWLAMKSRCYNETNNRFQLYGARGIIVCDGLRTSFVHFLKVVKEKPQPKRQYSIDRKNNDGNYACGCCAQCRFNYWKKNVRWATRSQQMLNRRPFARSLRRRDVSTAQIINLYVTQGLSSLEVHKILGISITSMFRRLQKAGIPARSWGTNQFSVSTKHPSPIRSTTRTRRSKEIA